MRRMYGEFENSNVDYGPPVGGARQQNKRTRHYPPQPPPSLYGDSYFNRLLAKRQTTLPNTPQSESGR